MQTTSMEWQFYAKLKDAGVKEGRTGSAGTDDKELLRPLRKLSPEEKARLLRESL